jgi:hypothetical protein
MQPALLDAASEDGVGGGRPADVSGADEEKSNRLFFHVRKNDKMAQAMWTPSWETT